jgi:hypothetical protein
MYLLPQITKMVTDEESEQPECSICLEPLDTQEPYKLNCNHEFHRDCITRWIHTNPNCPMCRSPVDADHRYVDDGIMTEERRQFIDTMKQGLVRLSQGLTWLFPKYLNNGPSGSFEQLTTEQVNRGDYDQILQQVAEKYHGPPQDENQAQISPEVRLILSMFGTAALSWITSYLSDRTQPQDSNYNESTDSPPQEDNPQ